MPTLPTDWSFSLPERGVVQLRGAAAGAAALADPSPAEPTSITALLDAFAFRIVGHLGGADHLATCLAELGDDRSAERALSGCVRLWTAHSRGDLEDADDAATSVAHGLRTVVPPLVRCAALCSLVLLHDLFERQALSMHLLGEAEHCAMETGLLWLLPPIEVLRAAVASTSGDDEAVIDASQRALIASSQFGSHVLVPMAHTLSAFALSRSGDRVAAVEALRLAEHGFLAGDAVGHALYLRARAEIRDGDPEELLALCCSVWDRYEARGSVTHVVALGPTAIRLARDVGDARTADALASCAAMTAQRTSWRTVSVTAAWLRGMVDNDAATLRRAKAEFQQLGRVALAEEVGIDLERLRCRSDRGPRLLTRGEWKVVRLLRAGLSNREIASTLVVTLRTVESHLTSVYRKLGVHSRSEAIVRLMHAE